MNTIEWSQGVHRTISSTHSSFTIQCSCSFCYRNDDESMTILWNDADRRWQLVWYSDNPLIFLVDFNPQILVHIEVSHSPRHDTINDVGDDRFRCGRFRNLIVVVIVRTSHTYVNEWTTIFVLFRRYTANNWKWTRTHTINNWRGHHT